jgi:hypothetical protein
MIINPTENLTDPTPQEILNDVKMKLNIKYNKAGIKFSLFGWYEEKIFTNYRLEISIPKTKQKKNLLTIKHISDSPYPVWLDSDKFLDDKPCENPQEFWDNLCLAVNDGKYIEEVINSFLAVWN